MSRVRFFLPRLHMKFASFLHLSIGLLCKDAYLLVLCFWLSEMFCTIGYYHFAGPGMHNIHSLFWRRVGKPVPLRGHISHGDRTIVVVDQVCIKVKCMGRTTGNWFMFVALCNEGFHRICHRQWNACSVTTRSSWVSIANDGFRATDRSWGN